MLDISRVFEAVRERCKTNGNASPQAVLRELRDMVGIENFTYLRLEDDDEEDGGTVLTTYSEDWHRRYAEMEYQFIDPVVQQGFKSFLPLDWSTIKRDDPLIRTFFGEAGEFGVNPNGLTVPIRDQFGRRALFSINSGMKKSEFDLYTRETASDIQYLAYLFHEHACREDDLLMPAKSLSRQERMVLRWAALGKTARETAIICDLKESTIKFYLLNATAKLEASNKTHAVAKAMRMGIITI